MASHLPAPDVAPADLDHRIRDYWNERVDDTRLSDHPRGTAGF